MLAFRCSRDASVESCSGALLTLLECDSNELLGTLWTRFIDPADWPIVEAFARDLAAGRGGIYRARAIAKNGDRLLLRTASIVGRGNARGSVILETWDRVRKYFPLMNAVRAR